MVLWGVPVLMLLAFTGVWSSLHHERIDVAAPIMLHNVDIPLPPVLMPANDKPIGLTPPPPRLQTLQPTAFTAGNTNVHATAKDDARALLHLQPPQTPTAGEQNEGLSKNASAMLARGCASRSEGAAEVEVWGK